MSGPPAKVQAEPAKAVRATAIVIANTNFFIVWTPFLRNTLTNLDAG